MSFHDNQCNRSIFECITSKHVPHDVKNQRALAKM